MNAFYKLACALVAWSALSLSAQAAAMETLSALPQQAFQVSTEHPDRLVYLKPGIDLGAYQAVMIEPLTMLGKQQGDWTLLVAEARSSEAQRYHQALTSALEQHGVQVASQPGPGVMRLRLALAIGDTPHPDLAMQNTINLEHIADGVDHYMAQISAVGQLEDSQSGALLAGGVDLKNQQALNNSAQTAEPLSHTLSVWTEDSAARLAEALGLA